MRNYELVFVLKPDLKEDSRKKVVDKIKNILKDLKAKKVKQDDWGEKELSYPIQKYKKGFYVQFNFSLSENKVSKLEEKIQLEEDIIRHLLLTGGKK